jgi:hypothetical protein
MTTARRTITSIAVKNHAGVEKSWTFGYTNSYFVELLSYPFYYNCQRNQVPTTLGVRRSRFPITPLTISPLNDQIWYYGPLNAPCSWPR